MNITLEWQSCASEHSTLQTFLNWCENNASKGAVAWHSLSNIAYLLKPDARPFLRDLLSFVDVAAIEAKHMTTALNMPMSDLEDAMQAACALAFRADYIISRNVADYKRSPIVAIAPAIFLAKI
jgi:hypothetical protein